MTIDLHQLAGAYSLDALDPDERAQFEAHLPECPTCSADVADFRATAAELAHAAAVPPPEAVRQRVLDEIATTRQAAPLVTARVAPAAASSRRWSPILLAAAACVLLVGGFVVGRQIGNGVGGDGGGFADVVDAPDAVVTDLVVPDGVGGKPGGNVQVVYSPSQQAAALIGTGLAAAGPGHEYEMWLVHDGGVASAGTFQATDGTAHATFDLSQQTVAPAAWALTIEPINGTPTPEGEIIYTGTV